MQFFISAEEGEKKYQALAGNENTSCVSVIFVQHPDECLLDLAHITVIPIYRMFPIIFYSEHIPDARENECNDIFYLYIKLFGAKVDGFCSMEPSGNLLVDCLKYGWFLVICFVCQYVYPEKYGWFLVICFVYQFVYPRTPAVLWRTPNNIIGFF